VAPIECLASHQHLEEFLDFPRSNRCPKRLYSHFQRAFLLNQFAYTCTYCRRTAWGVFAEINTGEPSPTLRFEIDHRITRRRLEQANHDDFDNLVVACRSCNTIKGEMEEGRFLLELNSLALAVSVKREAVYDATR